MKITYSIQVCNESRELYSLINFLLKVIDEEDIIQIIVDSLHKTDKVDKVIDNCKEKIQFLKDLSIRFIKTPVITRKSLQVNIYFRLTPMRYHKKS